MLSVTITCPVYPSENPDKVKSAIGKIFPDATITENDDGFEAKAEGLEHFSKLIRKQKILDSTRSMFIKGRRGENKIIFRLNKQVAFMGKVSFTEEKTILGAMKVVVESDEIWALIENVAPETVDGEEVLI